MKSLLERKLLVVTGKGGTGKTTVATALARLAAQQHKRVLLCEIERTGDIAASFDGEPVVFEPRQVEPNLWLMAMDTEAALHEYLTLNLKLPLAIRTGSIARALDFVAVAAPGVREILTIGKVCWDVKRELYDLIVVDAPSSGHVVAQLDAPDSVGELVHVGPLVSQTDWMRDILRDPERTGVVVVTTPEEIPVSETVDLLEQLRTKVHTPIGAVVVNRVIAPLFVGAGVDTFERLTDSSGRSAMIEAFGPHISGVIDVATFAGALRHLQSENIAELRSVAGADTNLIFLPDAKLSVSATSLPDDDLSNEDLGNDTIDRDRRTSDEVVRTLRAEIS